jgi:hypothetical protein
MNIISLDAQVFVGDSYGSSGVNIHSIQQGYVAHLHFWGGAAYLARRKNCGLLHVLVAPTEEWKEDIERDDFVIIGKLDDLAKAQEQLNNNTQPL